MDTTTLVIIGLAVVVIVLILLFARGGSRRPRVKDLQPLSNESRDRYLTEWDRVEMKFVEAPEEAVREADGIVMAVLAERRHPMGERMLPADVLAARKEATRRGDRTEGMRRAMLSYRAVMTKMVPSTREERPRREMA
jgi:hypothetical protein